MTCVHFNLKLKMQKRLSLSIIFCLMNMKKNFVLKNQIVKIFLLFPHARLETKEQVEKISTWYKPYFLPIKTAIRKNNK